jgi:uncharacterized protein involved in exopolysaccharide biosynthesis
MVNQEIEVRRYVHHSLPTVRDVAAVVFRHWKAMLVTGALIAGGTVLAGIWTPKYQAEMKILVQSRRTDAVVSSSSVSPVQFNGNNVTEEEINSEVELLKGDDLLRAVVRKIGMVPSNAGADDAAVALAADRIRPNLTVEAIRKTHMISLRYSAHDPKLASAVLDALGSAYIEKHAEVHRPNGESSFFDQEASRFRHELERAQHKITEFSSGRNVISAQAERDAALQQADQFESRASEVEALAAETASRIAALEQQITGLQPRVTTSIRTSENPQLMGQLQATLLNLQLKKSELVTKFAVTYPLVQEVDRQIAETKAAIQAAEHNPVQDQTTDRNPGYELVQQELTRARSELNGLRARHAASEKIALQYRAIARQRDEDNVIQQNLLRDAKSREDAYLLYVHKSEEAGISDALDRRGIVNAAIAQSPAMPHQPQRSPLGSLLLTMALMFVGTLGTAYVLDVVDPTFHSPDELATYLDAPVLAALPKE